MKRMMEVRYFSFSDFSDNCAQPVDNVFSDFSMPR